MSHHWKVLLVIKISIISASVAGKICQNGGTLNKNNVCVCPANFEGSACEISVNSTEQLKTTTTGYFGLIRCDHGRLDMDMRSFSFKCKCYENWEGDHCDHPICKNGNRNDKSCQCSGDWVGTHCDEKSCDEYREWSRRLKKCTCKKQGWEGAQCHLPICTEHGTRVIRANGNAFCECETSLWFGELCDQNKCGTKGTPYFALETDNNQTETVVKCKCNKGWIGDTCGTKDCHGHGRPILDTMCFCDGNFNIITDCATCQYGWKGENCNERQTYDTGYSYNSNSDSNYNYNSNSNSNSNTYSSRKSTNWVVIVAVGTLAMVASVICACLKRACRSSMSSSTQYHPSGGAHVSPPHINLRQPHPYPPAHSPARGADFVASSTNVYPASNFRQNNYWNPAADVSATNFGMSAPQAPVPPQESGDIEMGRNEMPPPPYADVGAEEPSPPPNYEDAVKNC